MRTALVLEDEYSLLYYPHLVMPDGTLEYHNYSLNILTTLVTFSAIFDVEYYDGLQRHLLF
jgi:hypothetical protein